MAAAAKGRENLSERSSTVSSPKSQKLPPPPPPPQQEHENSDEPTWFAALTTYLGFAVLILFGHLRDLLGKTTGQSRYFKKKAGAATEEGYAPLLQDFENFFTRRLYHRIQDCWNRPIAGPPLSGKLPVIIRETTNGNFSFNLAPRKDGKPGEVEVKTCINLSSYNYLGFADDWDKTCRTDVLNALDKFPVSVCSSFAEGGYLSVHRELEISVAKFVGKEDAVIFNMGWATNGLGIPSIVGKGCLIISDSLNHNSIVAGARSSGADVRVFKHNDLDGLEALVRKSILDGQPHKNRQWKKILIAVEGIYSMEGESVDLKGVVEIAKRYKCYVYLDEAHSIGAMGANGRGVCEHAGVDPADVDVLMGTFTKSFGAMGGYIAGSKEFVRHVRKHSAGFLHDNAMSPIVCQQIITAFKIMKGEDNTNTGIEKIHRLRDNSNYFRQKLIDMGLEVFGSFGSPVIPIMIYNPTKIAAFSRECLKRNLAVVVVGFPATPLTMARARFCISAGHTREELDIALSKIDEVATFLKLRYKRSIFG